MDHDQPIILSAMGMDVQLVANRNTTSTESSD